MSGTIPTMMVGSQRPGNECVLALRCSTPDGVPCAGVSPPRSVTNDIYQNENRSRLTFLTTRDSREHHRERECAAARRSV